MKLKEKIMNVLFGKKQDFSTLLEKGALVVDVRTKEEFRSGNKTGSKNIPLHELNGRLKELQGKEIILVCRSGARANQALKLLNQHNISACNAGSWKNI